MLRLHYWFTRLGRGEQIRLMLAELGLAWDEVDTPFGGEAWRALVPDTLWFSAQPVLVDDGFALGQSGVILSYLAEQNGIAPASLRERARADALAWTAEDLRMALFRATAGPDAGAHTARFLAAEWPDRWIAGLAHQLGGAAFLTGPIPTHADVALWDAVDQVRARLPEATVPSPPVAAWLDRVADRPRIAAYLASDRRPPLAFPEAP